MSLLTTCTAERKGCTRDGAPKLFSCKSLFMKNIELKSSITECRSCGSHDHVWLCRTTCSGSCQGDCTGKESCLHQSVVSPAVHYNLNVVRLSSSPCHKLKVFGCFILMHALHALLCCVAKIGWAKCTLAYRLLQSHWEVPRQPSMKALKQTLQVGWRSRKSIMLR